LDPARLLVLQQRDHGPAVPAQDHPGQRIADGPKLARTAASGELLGADVEVSTASAEKLGAAVLDLLNPKQDA
jgi:hypothetical protein